MPPTRQPSFSTTQPTAITIKIRTFGPSSLPSVQRTGGPTSVPSQLSRSTSGASGPPATVSTAMIWGIVGGGIFLLLLFKLCLYLLLRRHRTQVRKKAKLQGTDEEEERLHFKFERPGSPEHQDNSPPFRSAAACSNAEEDLDTEEVELVPLDPSDDEIAL